ncbi:5-carboxymethyl-2-hydroxymuconate Delta-isomerase [Actinacidiphila glaucinigra]|uniref:5-carboxymethyl-2-hydroxymuconate Delta-isomerase n=1 Tax=Actinacidiphila glaucinigra TaxID=235986 RepID=UPI00371970A4
MPHITVDYTGNLADAFDRRGFATALHPLVAKTIETSVEACKTRFLRSDEYVLADGGPEHALVLVRAAVLSGRTPEAKTRLSEAVLELLKQHLAPTPGLSVQTAVDIVDLDRTWYRSHTEPAGER